MRKNPSTCRHKLYILLTNHLCCSKTGFSLYKTSNTLWKHLLLMIFEQDSRGALQIQISLVIAEAWFSWSSLRVDTRYREYLVTSEANCSTLSLRLFPRQNMSYQGNCMLVLSNIISLSFLCILRFIQWLKKYLHFSVFNFYVTCNVCVSTQVLWALDDHPKCLHIGSGKYGETLIPFIVSKDDCTCLNANISKQSSSPLMPYIALNAMVLGFYSKNHLSGSSILY